MKNDTKLKKANLLFRNRNFADAYKIYKELVEEGPFWGKILQGNIQYCKSRMTEDFAPFLAEVAKLPARPKVLIADFRYPRFDMSAGELATYGIIKMFAELGYEVTFIPKESTELDVPYIAALDRLNVKCAKNVTYEKFKDLILDAAHDISIAYIFRPDVASLCIPRIQSVNSNAFIFYHAPDVYFRRERAQYEVDVSENRVGKEELLAIQKRVLAEIDAAATSDHVVCVSNSDTTAFAKALSNPELNLTGIEPPTISTFPLLYLNRKLDLPQFDQTNDICFVGGSEHTPNRDAIRWFLENVWVELSRRVPSLKFSVIGRTAPEEQAYYETFSNVVVVGWVNSIEEYLVKFRLSVAPLRYGAGIKGKVGASVIAGIPCVASKVAVEDMGFVAGEEIIVAETPADYINSILLLTNDEASWVKISRAGSSKAEQIYSEEATFKRFIRILNETGTLDTRLYSNFAARQANSPAPIHFTEPVDPGEIDVSIIIPGFNNESLTKACLASIYWSLLPNEPFSFEVIYADDCSAPVVVPEISRKFPNVAITQTSENIGFVGNCNNGAKRARGRFIVLLNNDTIVLPAWLPALFETIEAVEGCQVAGSKLLYANSKIQEAGASVWTDGRTCSVGRGIDGTGLDCALPEYNYVREVDYVSFASVIIRKGIWDALGGLSTEYGIGYFDDSDFCLQVKQKGGLILYAPVSEVVHNESASFSIRNSKSVASTKQKNRAIFRRKWADALIDHHLPYTNQSWDAGYGESICKANAARHNILVGQSDQDNTNTARQRHILYFSPFPSHPASHGNQTTIQKFGKFLQAEGHAVHFALLQSHMYTAQDSKDMASDWNSFDIIRLSHFPSCNGETICYDGWYVPGLGEQIALLCSKYAIDTIICSYVFQSKMLDFVPHYVLKILDTHDKFTDRYSILDKLGKPREFFSCTRQEEGLYLSRADVVLARRDEEAAYFDSISTAKVYTVPHLEDRAYLAKGIAPLSIIGMAASCNLINLDLVVSFIDELIRQKPDKWGFEIHIAGEVKSLLNLEDPQQARVASHPSVHFLGFVKEIRDFYASVDMIVCPIMSGTGINVKTVQALAYGMPVIATQHASKGIPTKYPAHLFKDVPVLVTHLLSHQFAAIDLAELADQSRKIYESYIDLGYNNFRNALLLDQPGLRAGIGLSTQAQIPELFSRKARTITNASIRKKRLARASTVMAIINNLEAFGPTWININEPLPNIQSDGGVGYWLKFKQPLKIEGDIFLDAAGKSFRLHKSGDSCVWTTSIHQDAFAQPGHLDLALNVQFDWAIQCSSVAPTKLCSVMLVRE